MNLLEDIQNCATAIQNGEVILYPTDTIWGIGCDATNSDAIDQVYQMKNRPRNKSCIILVPNTRKLLNYIASPPLMIEDIISRYQDRPTTFIFDQGINLPDNLINEDGSIAIRIPKDDFCIQLLKKIGKPLVSTSANLSGESSPTFYNEIHPILKQKVGYVAYHKRDDRTIKQPSRIIKILENDQIQVIRE